MDTALKTDEEKKEYFDSPDILDQKVTKLAEMIKSSRHFVAFTGAGISTSTGIPDFRSGINTVLKTGPGAWEKMAQKVGSNNKNIKVGMLKAIPSPTHMALVKLQQKGYLKFLISQNVDGLHRRSGFSPAHLAELHGNTNLEKCQKCKKQYLRDYRTRTAATVHDHKTTRKCDDPNCKGQLYDSIINFGENLPERELNDGFKHSEIADLHIVLGSSLRVTPAADMPAATASNHQNLVIVNLQKTPLDSAATLRINAMCDDVMILLMKKLNESIPEFTLERRLAITKTGNNSVKISSEDSSGAPYDVFKSVGLELKGVNAKLIQAAPFVFNNINGNGDFALNLSFFEHYNEPQFRLDLSLKDLQLNTKVIFLMKYNPLIGKWVSCERQLGKKEELGKKQQDNLKLEEVKKVQNKDKPSVNIEDNKNSKEIQISGNKA